MSPKAEDESESGPRVQKFDLFHYGFIRRFMSDIRHSVVAVLPHAKFQMAAVPHRVKCAFAGYALTCKSSGGESSGGIVPTFHGTNAENLVPIRKHGLVVPGTVIPGTSTTLQVANGSAAGFGIYTANLNAPQLSHGFCSQPTMLVCAVVLKPGDVIQHGDAQVCKDARCVVPLLEASGQSFRGQASGTSILACAQPAQPR